MAIGLSAVLLLCGCTSTEEVLSEAIEFRAELLRAEGCSFRAEVTADSGDAEDTFVLDCEVDAEGAVRFTVVAPDTICGITAAVTADGGQVTYDGMAMDFGLLAAGNVIPAAAPALAVCCWRGEYIAYVGRDADALRVTYEKGFEEKQLVIDTWFEKGLPIFAEVCYNQQSILRMTITNFVIF